MKRWLLLTSTVLGATFLYGRKKYKEASTVLKNIKVELAEVPKVYPGFKKTSITLLFRLVNTTNINFGFTTASKIAVKQIRVYSLSGVLLAKADTDINAIDLPPKGSYILPPIVATLKTGDAALFVLANFNSIESGNLVQKLKFELDIKAFGTTYTLNPETN